MPTTKPASMPVQRLTASERITAEQQLRGIDGEIRDLEAQTHYRWERTPERMAKLEDLKNQRDRLNALLRGTILS
ncbi:MAG TPA: hypothetical protein P5186_27645 [Candidatus Paceibacterota bacterium]|nr:hypothetical protein [Verrucomicrobiota bacterium]HRY51828.1 hypothetical protein [Candidatus Paceibacterota bacterium]